VEAPGQRRVLPCGGVWGTILGMPRVSSSRFLLPVLLLVVGVVCWFPGGASGDAAHRFEPPGFGAPGEGAGQFALVSPVLESLEKPGFAVGGSGVAVDRATGDVYVADTGNRRVDEFEADGVFMRAWGWGVADGSAKFESCGPDALPPTLACQRGLSGGEPGEFVGPRFIAVDNSGGASEGDVYVGDGAGSEAQNEIQLIGFDGATGGTFRLSYEGHLTAEIPFTRASGVNLEDGADAVNTREALETATGMAGAFVVSERINGADETIGLKVTFQGSLSETVTGLLECSGGGLVPEGTGCGVSLDRVGSTAAGEVVSKFSGDGVLEGSWGTGGQLGAPVGAFLGPLDGLAVDGAGVLWVYDDAQMDGFEENSGLARGCRVGFGSASGIAAGANPGELYNVARTTLELHTHVCEGTEATSAVAQFGSTPTGVAAGPEGDVFVDLGGSVADVAPNVAQPIVFGSLAGGVGLAASAGGGLFVAGAGEGKVDVFGVSLEADTLAPDAVTATSATLEGEVDAKGTEVGSCVFQYGETVSYGVRVTCEPAGPITGTGAVDVHASVSGLKPGVLYHYRLRVINKDGEALASNDEQLPTSSAGVVEESSTADIEPGSASLRARVNPEGVGETKCRIQYGTSTAYGMSAACEPGEELAPVSVGLAVSLHLEGLTAGVSYHWRVLLSDKNDSSVAGPDNTFVYIAKNRPASVAGECPNEALRGESDIDPGTGQPFSRELPDCRAYELVTPVQKNAAQFAPIFTGPATQVGSEGSRVIAYSLQCFAQSPSCTATRGPEFGVPFEFARTATGWVASSLAPPTSDGEAFGNWNASAQTGAALFNAPVTGQVSDTFYARQASGALEAVGPISEALPLERVREMEVVATADLSHIVFWDGFQGGLWPSLIPRGLPLYEYAGVGNSRPFMVDVEGGEHSTKTLGDCTNLALLGEKGTHAFLYALSASGKTVYFEVCPGGEEDGVGGGLYARIDGEEADARTVAVSQRAPSGAGADECAGVCASSLESGTGLEGVSEDGSRVFFTSAQQLTNAASEDEEVNAAGGCTHARGVGGCNLYMYEDPQSGGRLVDVSAGDVSGLGPEVQGVMGVSADGSHVYFIAQGVLTGANLEGGEPAEGADNLYMYEQDEAYPAGRTVFIATLPGDETASGDEQPETAQWTSHTDGVSVTPDGDFLVFTSRGALTGDGSGGSGGEQVYRYDGVSGGLARVSVGEHGFDDDGNDGGGSATIVRPFSKVGQPRRDPSMSDDGSVVVFQSPVGLTARALNDVPVNGKGESADLAQNIYEWDAPGTHGCGEAAGCIYLISDGQDASEIGGENGLTDSSVELLGTDASGGDIFFSTVDRLVPSDTNSQLDYYDARVDGGFPAPVEVKGCEGEACHGPGPAGGVFGSLPSETLVGEGNLSPSTGGGKPPVVVGVTRAQKLAKALAGCRKDKVHRRRVACERQARRRYGPVVRSSRHRSSSRRGKNQRAGAVGVRR
jgi:hypothetical protein